MVDRKEGFAGGKKAEEIDFGNISEVSEFTNKIFNKKRQKNASAQEYEEDADLLIQLAKDVRENMDRKREKYLGTSQYDPEYQRYLGHVIGTIYGGASNLLMKAAKKQEEFVNIKKAIGDYKKASEIFDLAAFNTEGSQFNHEDERLRYSGKLALKLAEDLERKSKKEGRLEQSLSSASLSIITLIVGIFFLSKNFFNSSVQFSPGTILTSSWSFWLGAVLLVVGISAGIFWLKKRK